MCIDMLFDKISSYYIDMSTQNSASENSFSKTVLFQEDISQDKTQQAEAIFHKILGSRNEKYPRQSRNIKNLPYLNALSYVYEV